MMLVGRRSGLFIGSVVAVVACGGTVTERSQGGANEGGSGGFRSGYDGSGGGVGIGVGSGGVSPAGSGGSPYYGPGGSNAGGWYPDETGGYPSAGGGVAVGDEDGGIACASSDPGGARRHGDYCGDLPVGPGLDARCAFASELVSEPLRRLLGHAECAPPLLCAPAADIPVEGGIIWTEAGAPPSPQGCTTTMGLGAPRAGGCVARPFTDGYPLAPLLAKETCGLVEVCVPCADPVSGASTGACPTGGGEPTMPRCGVFDSGPNEGVCFPQATIDLLRGNRTHVSFKQDECPPGDVCVPPELAGTLGTCPVRCTTTLGSFGGQYAAGACTPSYLVRDMNPSALAILTQGSCAPGELCSPCRDPLNSGAPTGICE
ncbi:MAG TPA: hypothetical protein VHE30_09455 [Polyangiaceae bacterium]|nr:hypothetical protein [Polyangiaceae bacterium]